MIGTNNVTDTPTHIAAGVKAAGDNWKGLSRDKLHLSAEGYRFTAAVACARTDAAARLAALKKMLIKRFFMAAPVREK